MATAHDDDMYLFQTGLGETPSFAGQDFDAFLGTPAPDVDQSTLSAGFLNPSDLTIKRESESFSPPSHESAFNRSSRGSASGSSSTSSESPANHERNMSAASTASPPAHETVPGTWGSGINGFSIPANMQPFGDTSMAGMDQDFEVSNQEMDSAFDFETAASTPSGLDVMNKLGNARTPLINQPFNRPANFAGYGKQPSTTQISNAQPQFFFAGSREASPLNAMVATGQGQPPWNKHSPSSGLEETFNHITMNGDSPGNATFSPNLHFSTATFSFDPESSTTPSTFTKDISSPPSTINSTEGSPALTVHPTSLKSRVETQIPIKMTLSSLPAGVKKLRLPRHTVSKPKFLAKPEVPRSQEIFELHTSLVCTSAIQDKVKLQRALARARGEEPGPYNRPSPTSSIQSGSSRDDEDKPLNGAEVQICAGCIQRERKRASRKKQKKPEEEELFQKDEERRVVVFNTNEIKEWVEVPREATSNETRKGPPQPGAVQVELPMRIACYCRHQNEKMGFQVIFTIKDCRDKVIAQALTNPIMITDDHKTHNPPSSVANASAPLPTPGQQLPGAGVFSTTEQEYQPQTQASNMKMSRQSYSMTDLHALQHNFNPNFSIPQTSTPFAIPTAIPPQTSNFPARNLSRPASPSGPAGPTTKRRKQSGSGKVPSGLTMTRLDSSHAQPPSSTMPNTAASSPYAPNMTSYIGPHDRHFAMPPTARSAPYGNSPPTPNGVDPSFAANINRSISQDNISRQVMISAPPSRQPSRPGSPGSARNSFGAADAAFGQAVNNQLMGHHTRRPPPLIHKLVPAEGSVTGGAEVTLLGNGFYQGLEVMFGDTEATTTTFWGEKCLNCIAPPALQPGIVPVVFKHDHPQYSTMPQQSQTRPSLFTYVDDREVEMYRLALRTVGKQLQHPTDDPYTAAQQLLQGQNQSMWLGHSNYGTGGGHQRHAGGMPMDTLELEGMMLRVLEHMDEQRQVRPPRFELRRPSGLTLLHLASSLGLTRFVAGLLSRGADPNMADNNGHTPMHHAAMNGHTHVIHRLRLAGANHRARSIRHYIPADLATSLLSYQATMTRIDHYRSRSTGGTPIRLHSRSSSSLRSFWENASNHYTTTDTDDTDDSEEFDDETPTRTSSDEPDLPRAQTSRNSAVSVPQSRRGSVQRSASQTAAFSAQDVPNEAPAVAPSAFMLAWRDHLVAQLQQFNESAQSVMPSLATLNGPLAALQDYQAYPMVRRVSALFPQRPAPRQPHQQHSQREGWWEALTGSSSPAPSSPPAYGDLYPENRNETDEDWSMKKASTLRAAAEAAADLHFDQQSSTQGSEATTSSTKVVVHVSKPIERIELSRDRKLFFFWIPLLAIVLALMIRSSGLTTMFAASNSQTQPFPTQEAVSGF